MTNEFTSFWSHIHFRFFKSKTIVFVHEKAHLSNSKIGSIEKNRIFLKNVQYLALYWAAFLSLDTFIGFIFNRLHAQTLAKCETKVKNLNKKNAYTHKQNNWMANNPRRFFYPQSTTTSIAQNACKKKKRKKTLETMYELECVFNKRKIWDIELNTTLPYRK